MTTRSTRAGVIPTATISPGRTAPELLAFTPQGVVRAPFAPGAAVVIGRSTTSDLVVDAPSVSRQHARFECGARPTVTDLGSRNGTFVRGARIAAAIVTEFGAGDPVRIGDVPVYLSGATATGVTLTVTAACDWFRVGPAEPVSLARRRLLARVLAGLVEARQQTPAVPVTPQRLRELGWPGERMFAASGANRVYLAVGRLRRLGLEEIIASDGDGYLIPVAIDLEVVTAPR
ncbi:MAG: FHA domain-containing protein [Myxococcales bacterium]|nr:FHA domain-containing protein [Myxococcales bacterium]MBK7190878.1 FHA domain-containing protein [Myxococcales bacterium]MBP6849852.1 FHA domain-containing protein [Kofleriaceae bacterium]